MIALARACPWGTPGGSAATAWPWEEVLKVVPSADGGDNIARSSEANLRDVKLVRAPPVELLIVQNYIEQ